MNFDKMFIVCEMAALPQSGMKQYSLKCTGCQHKCIVTFSALKEPSFVYAEKIAGVFSSLCRRLAHVDAEIDRRNGQLSLISDADKEA